MEILNFRDVPNDPYTIGTFDIYFGPKSGMTLKKYKLLRSKKGHIYFSGPAYRVDFPDGSKKWEPYVEFNEERGKDFKDAVMEALKPFMPTT